MQEPGKHYEEYAQPEQEDVPEGLGMSDFDKTPGTDNPADPAEKLLSPENIAKLRELGLDI